MIFKDAFETTSPPTDNALADERRRLAYEKANMMRYLKLGTLAGFVIKLLIWGSSVMSPVMAFLWVNFWFWMGAVVWLRAGPWFGVWSGTWFGAVTAAAAVAGALSATMFLSVAVLGILVVFVVLVFLEEKFETIDNEMTYLVDLDPESQPDECIALDQWRKQDDHIDAYLRAIAAQQRKPVFAEYQAAKQWMESAEEQQKLDRAMAACERFA